MPKVIIMLIFFNEQFWIYDAVMWQIRKWVWLPRSVRIGQLAVEKPMKLTILG